MKLYNEFIKMMKLEENPEYDPYRFQHFLDNEGLLGDNQTSFSKYSSIKRFYESTNNYNRIKISDLINNNINNINKVYKFTMDYEKSKQ